MRRRSKRDLITLIGVVIVVSSIVVVNLYMRKAGLREHFEKWRAEFEEKHRSQGVMLIDWKELHAVKGTRRTGATFPESLKKKNGRLVNICGFMSPIDQFKEVSEFMLLPVPMTCYFCDAPPMRDIIEVRLQRPADMVNEPVLIGGRLELHEGPKQTFFFTIKDAKWNEAVTDEELSKQSTSQEHKIHLQQGFEKLRNEVPEEQLLPGYQPPSTPSTEPGASIISPTPAPAAPETSAPAPVAEPAAPAPETPAPSQ